ncbi:MAG TPA: 3D domain-containing protein [Fimbriimonas sp.]|nr:3D domain-containing protein [Fimbriimonas sp.]
MRNCSQRVSTALVMLVCAVSAHAGVTRHQKERVEPRVETKTIAPPVRLEVSRDVPAGRIVRAHEGKAGSITRTYSVKFKDGRPVSKSLVKEERKDPDPTVLKIGRAGHVFNRGAFTRHRVLSMYATSYYSNVCGTGRTATGERAKFGVVAVDPRVIPLGSVVYVEGYGLALACDTGGAIKGNRIDLCYESLHRANSFRSHYVHVHVLR